MRVISIALVFIAGLFCSNAVAGDGRLRLSTEKPEAGSKLSFQYTTTSGKFKSVDSLEGNLYYFVGKKMYMTALKLTTAKEEVSGNFILPDSAMTFALVFQQGTIFDDNGGKGYVYFVYSRGRVVPQSYAAASQFYGVIGAYLLGLSADGCMASELLDREFAMYPGNKERWWSESLNGMATCEKNASVQLLESGLLHAFDKVRTKQSLLDFYQGYFSLVSGDRFHGMAIEIGNLSLKGKWQEMREYLVKNYNVGLAAYEKREFDQYFAMDDAETARKKMLPGVYKYLSEAAWRKGDINLFLAYAKKITDKEQLTELYDGLSKEMTDKGNYSLADSLCKVAIAYATATRNEWLQHPADTADQEQKWRILGNVLVSNNNYGYILYKRGKLKEALAWQQKLADLFAATPHGLIYQNYLEYLLADKQYAAARRMAITCIKNRTYTERVKEIFTMMLNDPAQYNFTSADAEDEQCWMREEVSKQQVNETAPGFVLKDLQGNKVSLGSCRGKIVILDFWATWCGPCKASFPAMQRLVDQYRNDSSVVFLFMDTKERIENEELIQAVQAVLKDSSYTFHVLLDEKIPDEEKKFRVSDAYGIEGIPYKFVIDQHGNTRFKILGYNGSNELTMMEMNAMIGLLKIGNKQLQPDQPYTINGTLKNVPDSSRVWLVYSKAGAVVTNTGYTHNGTFNLQGMTGDPVKAAFSIELKRTEEERKAFMNTLTPADELNFFLEPGVYTLQGNDNLMRHAQIKGGKSQSEFLALQEKTGNIQQAINRMWGFDEQAERVYTREEMRIRDAVADSLDQEMQKIEFEFAAAHPDSWVSLDVLKKRSIVIELPLFEDLFNRLSASLQRTYTGQEIYQGILLAKRTEPGKPSPVFTLPDTAGLPFNISSLKGKYVLIDFWASWCAPCRMENPQMVKAYEQYHNPKFEIVSVSLDSQKKSWLKAIQADRLQWMHISDLKGFNNEVARLYGIRAVPQNVLIDPSGTIVAKNLHGEVLTGKLAQLFPELHN